MVGEELGKRLGQENDKRFELIPRQHDSQNLSSATEHYSFFCGRA